MAERVYFLGAGASKTIYPELPLARDLTLQKLLEYNEDEYRQNAATPLQELGLLAQGPLANMGSASIEEVLGQSNLSGSDRTSIIQCILYRLSLAEREACPLLQSWLTQLQSKGHAIVTTNYDTVCERNLQRLHNSNFVTHNGLEWLDYGVPDHLCVEGGSKSLWRKCEGTHCLFLLKLHGSISWSRCNGTCGRYMLHPVAAFKAPQAMYDPYLSSEACPDCNGDPWSVLVPPVKDKQYDDKALQYIWNRAEQILGAAREIVFAGYSLPPSDDLVRGMLGRAHDCANPQKIIVVDQNAATVIKRLKEVYGDLVCEGGSDWRMYLQGILNRP